MNLEISTAGRDGVTVLTARGDIDVYTAPWMRDALLAADAEGSCRIVLDLAGCKRLDATGVGVLVGGLKRARARGGSLMIAAAPEEIRGVFLRTGLARVFGFHPSADEAVAAVAQKETAP